MTHYLKTLPEYYQAVIDGSKPFEIRKNDRDFKAGDKCILEEYTGIEVVPQCLIYYSCVRPYIDECGQDQGSCKYPERNMCTQYSRDAYTGRRCLIRIKEIFLLDNIGFENYVAFTFDILNVSK